MFYAFFTTCDQGILQRILVRYRASDLTSLHDEILRILWPHDASQIAARTDLQNDERNDSTRHKCDDERDNERDDNR